ncbi:hypothetical protein D9611_013514 [Ephemerocybe angulata]|uniref:Uncharacterized protein n=1 Tax=Ephemerocybe angulata TaxID=980116 RepID=A0A8H5FA96_9AGAR|nr:hypothetical protein D9611_013514 [Tulosesus angulatus]
MVSTSFAFTMTCIMEHSASSSTTFAHRTSQPPRTPSELERPLARRTLLSSANQSGVSTPSSISRYIAQHTSDLWLVELHPSPHRNPQVRSRAADFSAVAFLEDDSTLFNPRFSAPVDTLHILLKANLSA